MPQPDSNWIDSVTALSNSVLPAEIYILFFVALLVSSVGFYRMVYFVSTGYAFAIASMAGLSAYLFFDHLSLLSALQLVALGLYGLRLGSFLLKRELNPAYQASIEGLYEQTNKMKNTVKFAIWLTVSLLYVLMFSPALFHLNKLRAGMSDWPLWPVVLGLLIMATGLLIESTADAQKSAFKKNHGAQFCSAGLYRVVRYPNYSGEMLFWLGQFVAGIPFYSHALHWGMSLIGLISIQLIMIGSTRRLEFKQEERYGAGDDYQEYVRTVPVLLPLLPLYSVKNAKIYLG